jgi:hypothetical protein
MSAWRVCAMPRRSLPAGPRKDAPRGTRKHPPHVCGTQRVRKPDRESVLCPTE